jgi:hypothetical protein
MTPEREENMKYRHFHLFLLCVLTGCMQSHNINFVEQKSGDTAHATITTAGNQSGDITITLMEKTYTGRWVWVRNGGSVGIGSAVGFSGGQSASGLGSMFGVSTEGVGNILASSPDGDRLRCQFTYNGSGQTGIGLCEDSDGRKYDVQID